MSDFNQNRWECKLLMVGSRKFPRNNIRAGISLIVLSITNNRTHFGSAKPVDDWFCNDTTDWKHPSNMIFFILEGRFSFPSYQNLKYHHVFPTLKRTRCCPLDPALHAHLCDASTGITLLCDIWSKRYFRYPLDVAYHGYWCRHMCCLFP